MSQPKIRATLYVPTDVLDEVRDAAAYLGGHPAYLTLTKLVEQSLRAELDRLKEEFNHGHPFPRRAGPLKGGRPLAA